MFHKKLLIVMLTACGSMTVPARADVLTVFQGTLPGQVVDLNVNGTAINDIYTGVNRFDVVAMSDSRYTSRFDAYSAEFHQTPIVGNEYNYALRPIGELPGIDGNSVKMSLIQELYNRHYELASTTAFGGIFQSVFSGALQLVQWEIIVDGANGAAGLSFDTGNFTATSLSGSAYPVAQNWLADMGKPDVATQPYELIAFTSDTAQDQIAVVQNPVPAPPAAILGLLAIGMLGVRMYFNRQCD